MTFVNPPPGVIFTHQSIRGRKKQNSTMSTTSIQQSDTAQQGVLDPPTLVAMSTDRTPLLSSQNKLFRSLSGKSPKRDGENDQFTVRTSGNLTTFAGVFTPVCLSMFSALLFLRMGFIIGQAGVLEVLLQFLLAYAILIFTVLSISAISTNGAVEGGGVYYMISRTLGPEFGGSIGTLFFFANIFSSALYITGCVEGLVDSFGKGGSLIGNGTPLPSDAWWNFFYATIIGIFNLLVCLVGASMFARMSLLIFFLVMISMLSVVGSIFFEQRNVTIPIPSTNNLTHIAGNCTGFSAETFKGNIFSNYTLDYTTSTNPDDGDVVNFATVFGVLFSGVTGIMAGANMSGDLRDPGKSIPKGTLTAVAFTVIVYIILVFLISTSCTHHVLLNNYVFMQFIDVWPPFIVIGIFAATLSASLSNLIGASRILEAVAKDNLFGFLLRPITLGSRNGNPIYAVVASWLLVQMILLIGSLNRIAQVTSILFLLSYCATNIACLALELASAPNFRPGFKYFTWHTCVLGLIGTVSMMFVINAIYAAGCIIACLLLIIALHLRGPEANWGSISQALIFHQVRKYLLLLDSRKDHVKFWRPQMLLLVSNPRSNCSLIKFTNDLKKGGLYVLGNVMVGTFSNKVARDNVQDEYPYWLSLIDSLKVKAFVEVTLASTVREGVHHLVRLSGLGAMKANTILAGFYEENDVDQFPVGNSPFHISTPSVEMDGMQFPARRDRNQPKNLAPLEYVAMLQDIVWMQKNLCVCRHFYKLDTDAIKNSNDILSIDVWPINFFYPLKHSLFDTTTLFLLQLSCVLHMVSGWKKHTYLRIFLCTSALNSDTLESQVQLEELLKLLRIDASISVIVWDDELRLYTDNVREDADTKSLNTVSQQYIERVNSLIRRNSAHTAVSFIYLAAPPTDETLHGLYLQLLDYLTAELPPTVLVYGISPVTTTTL